jgi:VIT1/CCC1 family predicted Fe2+/Mn2+ transporter
MSLRSHNRLKAQHKPKSGFLEDLIDPIDRLSETIFSILILMTFTLAFHISAMFEGPEQALIGKTTNDLLLGALWAILVWGAIDGVMYALLSVFARGESHRLLWNIQTAESEEEAVEIIAGDLDYILEPISEQAVRQKLYKSILENLRDSQPRKIGLTSDDLIGALSHVLVALIAVLPSLAPLLVFRNNFELAILVSNLVSIVMLFIAGYFWGKYTGGNPWKIGLLLMIIAVIMALAAIFLGG